MKTSSIVFYVSLFILIAVVTVSTAMDKPLDMVSFMLYQLCMLGTLIRSLSIEKL